MAPRKQRGARAERSEQQVLPGPTKSTEKVTGSGQTSQADKTDGLVFDEPTTIVYQKLLDTFISAFQHLLSKPQVDDVLPKLLQQIKGHLYNRDFEAAFGCDEYLEAYVVRWSPSRALCYLGSFGNSVSSLIENPRYNLRIPNVEHEISNVKPNEAKNILHPKELRVTCLGGGAAELAALAFITCVCKHLGDSAIQITLIDKADWSDVLEILHAGLTSQAPASANGSGSEYNFAKPSLSRNSIVDYTKKFHRMDLLNLQDAQTTLLNEELHSSNLVTLMFTLNELYSSSISSTQSLLLNITSTVSSGTLLLVVDSAGSYSTVTINEREKKYPMQWLLDYTLMKMAPKAMSSSAPLWELVMTTDSQWFRLPKVSYPLELENMRYQQHVYRRT